MAETQEEVPPTEEQMNKDSVTKPEDTKEASEEQTQETTLSTQEEVSTDTGKEEDTEEITQEAEEKEEKKEEKVKSEPADPPHFPFNAIPAELLPYDKLQFSSPEELKHIKDFETSLLEKHKIVNIPPQVVARYLLGSKFRPQMANRKYSDMIKLCRKYELYKYSLEDLKSCFKELSKCMSFAGTDKEGNALMVCQYANFYPNKFKDFGVIVKCMILLMDIFTQDLDVSRKGIVFVADMKDFGWSNFSIDLEKLFVTVMQDIYPLRIKGMYMVEASALINIILKMIKPFLKKKMRDRMYIVNRRELYQVIDANQLPTMIGGSWECKEKFYDTCVRYVESYGDQPLFFDSIFRNESKIHAGMEHLAAAGDEPAPVTEYVDEKEEAALEQNKEQSEAQEPKVEPKDNATGEENTKEDKAPEEQAQEVGKEPKIDELVEAPEFVPSNAQEEAEVDARDIIEEARDENEEPET